MNCTLLSFTQDHTWPTPLVWFHSVYLMSSLYLRWSTKKTFKPDGISVSTFPAASLLRLSQSLQQKTELETMWYEAKEENPPGSLGSGPCWVNAVESLIFRYAKLNIDGRKGSDFIFKGTVHFKSKTFIYSQRIL